MSPRIKSMLGDKDMEALFKQDMLDLRGHYQAFEIFGISLSACRIYLVPVDVATCERHHVGFQTCVTTS